MGIKLNDISAPAGDAFKFENIGDKIKGVVTHAQFKDQVNKFNNQDETVLVITLETEDGESSKLYPRVNPGSQMAQTVADAVQAAGADELAIGGTLAVAFKEEKDVGKGYPMKVYVAAYEPPKASTGSASVADLLG